MPDRVLKKFLGVVLFVATTVLAVAQTDTTPNQKNAAPVVFHVAGYAGLLAGANGRDLQLQLQPGLQYKTWFAGIGGGLDYYYFRSVPFFINVRKLFQTPMPVFLYASTGTNIPWMKKSQKETLWYTSTFKGGYYYDVGAGWQLPAGRQHAVLLSAGYSAKRIVELQKSRYMPPGTNEELYTTRLAYDLRRFSIKVGYQF